MIRPVIKVISEAEAEKLDFYVCPRKGTPTPFRDNLTGPCHDCGHPIIFRPYAPTRPVRICVQCMNDRLAGGHA